MIQCLLQNIASVAPLVTSLEIVVDIALQLVQEKNDFFPLNRALSLSAMDEDSTESKVDELLRQVHHLVERQREEVSLSLHLTCWIGHY